jgi:hypothetical protein
MHAEDEHDDSPRQAKPVEFFDKETEKNMLKERLDKQEEEFKKINELYSEGFLKRLLRLLEMYTSLATTFILDYLLPL